MNFGPLGSGMQGQLIRRDDRGTGPFGDFHRIPVMIPVTVGNQNEIRRNLIGRRRRLGIPRQKGIDQDFGFGGGQQKTGMSQILYGDSLAHFFSLGSFSLLAASAAITLVFLSASSKALQSFCTEEGTFFTLPARMSLDSTFSP